MLQIMSGKFFRGEERQTSLGKGILYSNFTWVRPIVTCVGTLEPVDAFATVSGYVFSYTNQMEKVGELKAGDPAPTGDREIVSQFAHLAMFALNACFDAERSNVTFNCRANPIGSHERYVPSRFVDGTFQTERRGTVDDEARLVNFVAKAIAMPRAQYTALLDVLDALQRAYYAINESLDLAYSMVVYCLESLAQRFDNYEPSWDDYEERPRRQLDTILKDTPPDASERIRSVLIEGAHLKLRARLVHFVRVHMSSNYFTSRTAGKKWPLRASLLERALSNAYVLRSGYVHQLRSIQEQLHQSFIAEGEVFVWEREPYLTLRGLMNIACDVIKNFVERAPQLEKEIFNWRADLPGTTTLAAAPQYWIWNHEVIEGLTKAQRFADVKARYHGLLQIVLDIALQPGSPLVDLRSLMCFYERLIDQSGKDERPAIMATYVLFNSLVAPKDRAPKFERLSERFAQELRVRTIESMTLEAVLEDDIGGDLRECLRAYQTYSSSRFSVKTLQVPPLIEVKVLAAIANKALAIEDMREHARLLDIATGEAAGLGDVQARLAEAKASRTRVDLTAIFTLSRKAGATSPSTSSADENSSGSVIETPGSDPAAQTESAAAQTDTAAQRVDPGVT